MDNYLTHPPSQVAVHLGVECLSEQLPLIQAGPECGPLPAAYVHLPPLHKGDTHLTLQGLYHQRHQSSTGQKVGGMWAKGGLEMGGRWLKVGWRWVGGG